MRIRNEGPADGDAIRAVHESAFKTDAEAKLVDRLRSRTQVISLVADDAGSIVGHILFSPVTLSGTSTVTIVGLAPIAVTAQRQRQGIGSALVRAGLDACAQSRVDAVVLIGHATYYPRFGFKPASRFGFRCEYDVPDDVFMALELRPGALAGAAGTIRYHPAFAEANL